MAIHLAVGEQFSGMLAAVVSLDSVLRRLEETSARGPTVFVVDHSGRVIAHPNARRYVPGTDLRSSYIGAQASGLPQDLRTTATAQHVSDNERGPKLVLIVPYN